MPSKKCKKCHATLTHPSKACENCGEKPSRAKQIMAWFCIILLLVGGMIWAFTDTEPDVTVLPTPQTDDI